MKKAFPNAVVTKGCLFVTGEFRFTFPHFPCLVSQQDMVILRQGSEPLSKKGSISYSKPCLQEWVSHKKKWLNLPSNLSMKRAQKLTGRLWRHFKQKGISMERTA
ncbi:hypothetical protein RE735_10525 [Bacillus aerius]|uniref:hypothetical protein n=1 Tax=Bacillus aerius TaxID=293388 RepID=UPI0028163EA9|nr:hypothetical protein [Bacillus aerius]WMT27584.1 hypothetical protein RE735_10525 [Bacillus aerius]